jgi:hypothetical protein
LAEVLVHTGPGVPNGVEDDLPALLNIGDRVRADDLGEVHYRGRALGLWRFDQLTLLTRCELGRAAPAAELRRVGQEWLGVRTRDDPGLSLFEFCDGLVACCVAVFLLLAHGSDPVLRTERGNDVSVLS